MIRISGSASPDREAATQQHRAELVIAELQYRWRSATRCSRSSRAASRSSTVSGARTSTGRPRSSRTAQPSSTQATPAVSSCAESLASQGVQLAFQLHTLPPADRAARALNLDSKQGGQSSAHLSQPSTARLVPQTRSRKAMPKPATDTFFRHENLIHRACQPVKVIHKSWHTLLTSGHFRSG